MHNIGIIGLGIMGKPIALNVLRAGYKAHVYARKREAMKPLIAEGAIPYGSPAELASECDVIISIVGTTTDVEEVLLGRNGVIQTARPGTIVIDMSTISPFATKRIAEQLHKKQIEMLDAPVSGGDKGAADGTLTIMVGGNAEVLNKVEKLLRAIGKHITLIGDHGAGQVAKACNQIIVAETIVAVSEAMHLAKKSGVDPNKVREALMHGFAASKILEIHGQRMLENNYQPGFKASLHRKDMHLALDQAHLVNLNLPAASYAMKCIDRLVMKGHSELDSSALHTVEEV